MAQTQPIYILEGVNLFCGDDDPSSGKHLTLDEMKMPVLQRTFQDHTPGGSPFSVEFGVGVAKLESTFKLIGFDPIVAKQFGYGSSQSRRYTAYAAYRDKRTGLIRQARSVIEGQMGKIEGDTAKRGELQGHDYAINEILHYELYFDDDEIYYMDFWTSTWRVNGEDENADTKAALMI